MYCFIDIPDDPVESLTHTAHGDELGPKEFGCGTPEDCVTCEDRETCKDYEPEEDEQDEVHQQADDEEDNG